MTTLLHDWDKRENKVKVLLKMSIKENIIRHIRDCKSLRKVTNYDLVTITLNEMTDEYRMFITGLSSREKTFSFEELIRILIQEEESW